MVEMEDNVVISSRGVKVHRTPVKNIAKHGDKANTKPSKSSVSLNKSRKKKPSSLNEFKKRKQQFLNRINYTNTLTVVVLPLVAIAYLFHNGLPLIPSNFSTMMLTCGYFHLTMLAFTAGYHKYFTHKTFKVRFSAVLYFFVTFGAGIGLGPVRIWAGLHRAHHHFIDDTERDPYSIKRGFLWAQWGWLVKKPKINTFYEQFIEQEFPSQISNEVHNEVNYDISPEIDTDITTDDEGEFSPFDYSLNCLLLWQQKYYFVLFVITSIIIPGTLAVLICHDTVINGIVYVGILRMVWCQLCLLSTESICHSKHIQVTVPTQPFNDKNSSINCNNPLFSLLTYGQGHDNFHHEFPHDYRANSSILSYDPTKWFIRILEKLGLVYDLSKTPENLIMQLKIQQQQQVLNRMKSQLNWGTPISKLPLITPKDFKRIIASSSNKDRIYIIIHDIIHDITPFMDQHPGGIPLLKASHGKDATKAFYGGVYGHSTAAVNLLATMRIGVLDTGNREDVWQRVVSEEGDVVDNDERTKSYQTAEAA